MIWFYRLLYLPVLLLLGPYYLWRMRRRGGYTQNFRQRFGLGLHVRAKRPGIKRVWLQAVSVGELLAVAPVLERLSRRRDLEVYLTTTTSTAQALARERYAALASVGIGYFPLDFWFFSAQVWKRVQPDVLLTAEGDWWPETLHQARRRGVPTLLLNARVSDRSFRRLWQVRPLAEQVLSRISRILASSARDERRFRALGVPAASIEVTGNLKLDVAMPGLSSDERADLRRSLGFGGEAANEPLILASSIWPGEERAVVKAFRAARERGHRCRLLIVPRHAERRWEIQAGVSAFGYRPHLRSKGDAPGEVDICIADTTGELRKLTQLADIVFVGKSLTPYTEGQSPVEAAALGKPLLFGPGMSNFQGISRELIACGAAHSVPDETGLAAEIVRLLDNPEAREESGRAAQEWHRANRGALDRTLSAIDRALLNPQVFAQSTSSPSVANAVAAPSGGEEVPASNPAQ